MSVSESSPLLAPENAEGEAAPAPPPKVSFSTMFRYATGVDYCMMLFGSLAALATGGSLPAIMLIFGKMINNFLELAPYLPHPPDDIAKKYMNKALMFGLYYLIIACVALILGYLQYSLWMWTAERQARRIRQEYFKAIMRQNIAWFDELQPGELTTRIASDTQIVQDALGEKLGMIFQLLASFLGGFVIAFTEGWRLTLVMIAVMPVLAACGAFMGKLMASFATKGQEAYAKAGAVAEEVISSMRTVAAFSLENKLVSRYLDKLGEAQAAGIKKGLTAGGGIGFTMFALFCSYSLAFWYGGRLVVNHTDGMTGGTVLTVFFSVMIGSFALGQSSPSGTAIVEGLSAAAKIFAVIDRTPPIDSRSEAGIKLERINGEIEFKDIRFSYPKRADIPILNRVNLRVLPGQTLALVGSSGCGKSTIVALLERFYDPISGRITVDGVDTNTMNIKWLREQIGLVSQEPALFDMTISENIALGTRHEVTEAEIIAAAKEANAHDFISQLPRAYNTLVGEKGTQLSGGQKQRIAIARALIKKPKILLLDEATSALDTQSEKVVQEALDKVRLGRTTIVIAHRLSTVRDADIIAVFGVPVGEEGRGSQVIEVGTHQQLIADENSLYYGLVKAQDLGEESRAHLEHKERNQPVRGSSESIMIRRSVSSGLAPTKTINVGDKQYTAITMGDAVEPPPLPTVPIWRVAKVNLPEWPYVCIGLVGAILAGAAMPFFAIIFSQITSVFAEAANPDLVDKFKRDSRFWSLMFVVLGFGTGLANFLQSFGFTFAGEKLTSRLREWTFRHILKQEIGFFDQVENSTGALTTRLANDATLVQGMLGVRLASICQSLVSMTAGLGIAFASGPIMTLVVLGCVPFIAASGYLQMSRMKGYSEQARKSYETAGKVASEALENVRTVVSLAREEFFYKRFEDNLTYPYYVGVKRAQFAGLGFGLSQFFIFMAYAVGFTFGAYEVIYHGLSIAKMLQVFSAVVFSAMAVGQASSLAPDFSKARAAANGIFYLLDREPAVDGTSDTVGVIPPKFEGKIDFHHTEFTYPLRPTVKILQGLDLHVNTGRTLALVGPSGCGKSTVVSLIERFYELESGQITIDGRPLQELNLKWLRRQIGLVSQEPVLFATSIKENIENGKEGATMEEITAAARAANIHDFIAQLPQGYDTPVGDKGTQLSGGQKQRVAIARALIRNPTVLLLDEATSALDTESERVVQEALDRARMGRTTIVIAHRLSTVQNADKLMVIQAGRVLEQGTHEELMKHNGLYAELVRNQQLAT